MTNPGPEPSRDASTTQDLTGVRVLGFCDHFTASSSGGAEKVTAEVYSRLIGRGAEIAVVSAVPGGTAGVSRVAGIPTHTVPSLDLSRWLNVQVALSPRLARATSRVAGEVRPHVLHASSLHFQGSVAAARHSRRSGLPLVTTVHVGSVAALPRMTRAAARAYEATVGRMILRSSAKVIAVSEAVAAHVGSLGVPDSGIVVVPNGVDHDRFRRSARAPGPVRVVFVGRLIGNKGPDDALAAFAEARAPGATLTFVGDGPMRRRLQSEVRLKGLGDSVRFTGHVSDVATALASADVLVRPSRTEGQSLAVLEAMAAGVCVLASDIEGNRELLGDGEAGLLAAPGDRDDLTRKLRALMVDPSLRVRLADEGARRSLGYSWEECSRATAAVLVAARRREEER
jgi:glycosyltransferase involved in cell wall biosynthesis